MANDSQNEERERLEWCEFIVDRPPNTLAIIEPGATEHRFQSQYLELLTPDVEMRCNSCNGPRMFVSDGSVSFRPKHLEPEIVRYECRNCQKEFVYFALIVTAEQAGPVTVLKIGQFPQYGPTTPTELLDLLGRDRDLYLRGRRAESQGMGIGAFAYYRRAVENAKDRLFDQIIEIASKQRVPEPSIKRLKQAKGNFQFDRAMDDLKDVLPTSLLIDGKHNPMRLLHKALSRSVHRDSDQQCLERAIHARRILFDMAERIARARRDDSELKQSVAALMSQRPKAS